MKRPYRVSKIGGGKRAFAKLESAVAFAASQARASWAQQPWSVWDTSQTNPVEPFWNWGVCVRLVSVDGSAWDPNASGTT